MKRNKGKIIAFGVALVAIATAVFYNFEQKMTGKGIAKAASTRADVTKCISSKKVDEFNKYAITVENIKVPQETKIVGLGEASHGNVEFQELKLEVLKSLVKNNGVRAFVLESDFGGGAIVNDYVLGRGGKLEDVVKNLDFAIYQTKQMMNLIEWIKEYNSGVESNDKVYFYGCDMQIVKHNYDKILDYYKIVNENKVEELKNSAIGLFDNYFVDIALSDKCNLWVENVKHDLENNKDLYVSKTVVESYEYAMQYVECMSMSIKSTEMDNNSEFSVYDTLDYRDKCMSLIVENILEIEKSRGHNMIMLSGHNGHIAKKDSKWKIMGQWLTEKYGKDYYVIGTDCYKTECNIQVTSKNEREIFKLCSKDPLAKLMKNNPNKYMFLEFGNVEVESSIYKLINSNMKMISLGEGFEKWYKFLPYYYRPKQVPTELYDGMIFVYKTTPIEIIK